VPALEEIVQEILGSILVAGCSNILLRQEVIIGMISLPRLLLPLFGNTRFFFSLREKLAPSLCVTLRVGENEIEKGSQQMWFYKMKWSIPELAAHHGPSSLAPSIGFPSPWQGLGTSLLLSC